MVEFSVTLWWTFALCKQFSLPNGKFFPLLPLCIVPGVLLMPHHQGQFGGGGSPVAKIKVFVQGFCWDSLGEYWPHNLIFSLWHTDGCYRKHSFQVTLSRTLLFRSVPLHVMYLIYLPIGFREFSGAWPNPWSLWVQIPYGTYYFVTVWACTVSIMPLCKAFYRN